MSGPQEKGAVGPRQRPPECAALVIKPIYLAAVFVGHGNGHLNVNVIVIDMIIGTVLVPFF